MRYLWQGIVIPGAIVTVSVYSIPGMKCGHSKCDVYERNFPETEFPEPDIID